jgi:hypothetical protein
MPDPSSSEEESSNEVQLQQPMAKIPKIGINVVHHRDNILESLNRALNAFRITRRMDQNFINYDVVMEEMDDVMKEILVKISKRQSIADLSSEYITDTFVCCSSVSIGYLELKDPLASYYAQVALNTIQSLVQGNNIVLLEFYQKLSILDHIFLQMRYWISERNTQYAGMLGTWGKSILDTIDRRKYSVPTFLDVRSNAAMIWATPKRAEKLLYMQRIFDMGDAICRVESDTLLLTCFSLVCDRSFYNSLGTNTFSGETENPLDYNRQLHRCVSIIGDLIQHSESPIFRAGYFTCLAILKYRVNASHEEIRKHLQQSVHLILTSRNIYSLGNWIIGLTLAMCVQVGEPILDPLVRILKDTPAYNTWYPLIASHLIHATPIINVMMPNTPESLSETTLVEALESPFNNLGDI